jgi:hypothetical protein
MLKPAKNVTHRQTRKWHLVVKVQVLFQNWSPETSCSALLQVGVRMIQMRPPKSARYKNQKQFTYRLWSLEGLVPIMINFAWTKPRRLKPTPRVPLFNPHTDAVKYGLDIFRIARRIQPK